MIVIISSMVIVAIMMVGILMVEGLVILIVIWEILVSKKFFLIALRPWLVVQAITVVNIVFKLTPVIFVGHWVIIIWVVLMIHVKVTIMIVEVWHRVSLRVIVFFV
jgi:hypothetical protein